MISELLFQKNRNEIQKLIFHFANSARINGKASHLGGALSVSDILCFIYGSFNISTLLRGDQNNLILSKGHACLALYATLCQYGYGSFSDEIDTYGGVSSPRLGHPIRDERAGIQLSSGSLGIGLSMAVGIALGKKKEVGGGEGLVFVIVGDGELNEGVCYEVLRSASHFKLSRLVVIVDNNGFQQTGPTSSFSSKLDIHQLFLAMGFYVIECDGHSYDSLLQVFTRLDVCSDRPTVIIANTIKGYELGKYQGDNKSHHIMLTESEIANLLRL